MGVSRLMFSFFLGSGLNFGSLLALVTPAVFTRLCSKAAAEAASNYMDPANKSEYFGSYGGSGPGSCSGKTTEAIGCVGKDGGCSYQAGKGKGVMNVYGKGVDGTRAGLWGADGNSFATN